MFQENKRQKLPTYQVNIPANVRFDRKLSAHAKLLYGEIKALCDKEGYCWATNRYLASLYGVKKETISYWLRQLKNRQLIRIQIIEELANQRRILLSETQDATYQKPTPSSENIEGVCEKAEDQEGKNGIGIHHLSAPSYDLIARKDDPLLIANIIDYNDRVYINNMSTKNGIGIEKKGNSLPGERLASDSRTSAPSPPVAAAPPSPKSSIELSSKPQKPAFIKPDLRQVEDYMLSQKDLCPDAAMARGQAPRFVNYYEANGWKVGRNPMQDWQAAANNWLLNAKQYQSGSSGQSSQSGKYSKRRPNAYLFTERNKDYGIPF